MLSEAPFPILLCAVVGLLLVALASLAVPGCWRGDSDVSPENPPAGWILSPELWRRAAYGMTVGIPMFGLAAVAVLLTRLSTTAADVVLMPVLGLALLWLAEVFFARPRFLIPPAWRPDGGRSAAQQ